MRECLNLFSQKASYSQDQSADFAGFEEVSGKQSEELRAQQLDTDDYSIGEYVLIYGRCGPADDEQIWVGKIAKKYKQDRFGIHWLYHPSHLVQVNGLKLPQSLKQKTPQFDPWELIISEHGSIIDKHLIMARVGMLERAGAVEQKEQGIWWWDWVIRYRREYDLVANTAKNTPYMTTSRNYFRKRRDMPDWDITLRAQEMGLQAIEPMKVEKKTTMKEEKRVAKKVERGSVKAETTFKRSKRTIQDAIEDNHHDTPRAGRQRKDESDTEWRALPPLDKYLRLRTLDTDDCVFPNMFDDDVEEELLSPARDEAEGRISSNPSNGDSQSHDGMSNAAIKQGPVPRRADYSLRSIERSQVDEPDEVSDVDEELQYLFVDHDTEESEAYTPDAREDEIQELDLVDGDSGFPVLNEI